ncbi:MAG: metallophosphoesterase [Chitinophagales bacterium]|nr:metallophosphoesterase [Chitinophagales bacterium]
MRTFSLLAAILCTIFFPNTENLQAQTVVRGPYLQLPTQTSIFVKWRTDVSSDSKVSYGSDPNNLSMTETDAQQVSDHSVKLTGLSPFTKYYYSIGTITQTLSGPDSLHHFMTIPPSGTVQPIRIWAIGDFGKANQTEQRVRDSYLSYTEDTHTDVFLWLGDNTYDNGTDQQYQDKVFNYNYYGHVFKYMPFWPTPGNHDYESVSPILSPTDPTTHTGPYYDIIEVPKNGEAGGVPSGYELYYSFDYGNVHFISLNSEVGAVTSASNDWTGANPAGGFSGSPMTQWLEQDLQANTLPWVVVYFHQPPYTKGSHDSDDFWEYYMAAMRKNFVPIFDQYKVDLVLCGHSHVFERSYVIKGHYGVSNTYDTNTMLVDGTSGIDSLGEAYVKDLTQTGGDEGTVYVVCGSSGSLETGAALNHPVMFTGYADKGGSYVLDVEGNRLDGKFINEDGLVLDHFTMFKGEEEDTTTFISNFPNDIADMSIVPNPFTNETLVSFSLKKELTVTAEIFDMAGKRIKTLFANSAYSQGSHSFTVTKNDISSASGVFLLRLHGGEGNLVERIIRVD